MSEVLDVGLNKESIYYLSEFEDSIFNPVPAKRTEVTVILAGSELMTKVAETMLNEMNRVYKGFAKDLTMPSGQLVTVELISDYLNTLIYYRICRSTGVKPDSRYVVPYNQMQVPAFMYPILAAVGPVIDTDNGRRYVPVIKDLTHVLKRDEAQQVSQLMYSLRQYNFSSEAGIPMGNGSLDLMRMNNSEASRYYQTKEGKFNDVIFDSNGLFRPEQETQVSSSSMVFSLHRCHPVNGFFAAFLGLVNTSATVSEDLRVNFGNISDYVGSISRILRPRQ